MVTDRDWVMENNCTYTQRLWAWCARAQRPLIYASSAATYGDGTKGYDDGGDPSIYRPLNYYAESKQAFDLWQAKGFDTRSLVQDPQFADPQSGDFSLPADSPAIRIGFKPIDMSTVGPRRALKWE